LSDSAIPCNILFYLRQNIMKAAIISKYGPPEVLTIQEVAKPTPQKNEILVEVMTSAVNSGDARIRGANFPKGFGLLARLGLGIRGPRTKILGVSFSGIVAEVGSEVSEFKVGDEVFGMTGAKMGAYAQYLVVNSSKCVVHKPKQITHEEAAALPFGGTTALHFLQDKARLESGQKILINGASGSVGASAVQIAKYLGANVTGVCSSVNIDTVRSLGAEKLIDYTKENIYEGTEKYDVVMDTVGNISVKQGKSLLKPGGKLILIVAGLAELIMPGKDVITGTASEKKSDVELLGQLAASLKYKAVIDKVFPLDQIVEAHRYVDTGHKIGNVVLKIG